VLLLDENGQASEEASDPVDETEILRDLMNEK
jgi:hypothetical protein